MIHRIRVQNFKSLVDVTVDLSPVTVLIGRSGTGKSNFVHALRFLRDVLAFWDMWRQKVPNQRFRWHPVGFADGLTNFEVEFSIGDIYEKFHYNLSLGLRISQAGPLPYVVQESLRLGGWCLFHQSTTNTSRRSSGQSNAPEWVVTPQLVEIPDPGTPALGRIPSIPEIVDAYTALTSGIGCYMFSDAVLSRTRQQDRAIDLQQESSSRFGLNDAATNYLDVLVPIMTDLHDPHVRKEIVGALQRVNSSIVSVALNDIHNPEHVVVGHKFDKKTLALQLSQESDGFRRFYAHLLALYQRPPKQTLLFEHPEDGIHPGALAVLAEEFQAAPQQHRGQVILTTHSPELLDQFNIDQIRVVELDGFQTRIGPVSPEQAEAVRENLLDPGELLTVDPARIQRETTEA